MWRRFLHWLSPPMDPLVPMSMLVLAADREHPGWTEIIITRRLDRPEGGVDMLVRK